MPTSIDVAFANGGLTGTGGHPLPLITRNLARGVWTESNAEGAFYLTVDDQEDLESVWEQVIAPRPDFLKTHPLYSEEDARRRNDPAFVGKGVDPALLPEIVW
ncbi:MAG: hypothetical protein M3374_05870 [Pseudomonadota bacterium]|nr:hypothetical protein [Pseudomonadota bacterium]